MEKPNSQGTLVPPLDALWSLYKSQPKAVRKAFVKRLQEEDMTDKPTAAKRRRKTGLELAEEDVEKGRVTRWGSVDEMFNTILGKEST